MNLRRVNSKFNPMYEEAIKLYKISFPYHEQRENISQENVLNDEEYHFELIYDREDFVGVVLYWEHRNFIYIEHLCILTEMRNHRYGQRALELLKEKNKTLILEIDPPVDDISKRRKGFYERCGFKENGYEHIHPPYHKENQGHKLVIMSNPKGVSEESFNEFSHYLKNTVMRNVF